MNVKLLNYTSEPEKIIVASALTCHSKSCINLNEVQNIEKTLKMLIGRGHYSVLEHASFTFAIDGISRSCSHQLVRHRIASYSQQSQRYVFLSKSYVIPQKIKKNAKSRKLFNDLMEQCWQVYKNLIDLGIDIEDARYVLPNATTTSLIMTMNARELMHFFELRLCTKAQWEIRLLAEKIQKVVKKVAPVLFSGVGPICKHYGYCIENEPCKLLKS